MESVTFTLQEATVDQEAAYRLLWFQSVEGYWWNTDEPIDTILVENLVTDRNGMFVWTSEVADPELFSTIRTQSITGVVNSNSIVLPPRVNAIMCQLYIDLRDLEVAPRAGIAFTIRALTKATQGLVIDNTERTYYTDYNGVISVFLPQRCIFEVASVAMGETVVTVYTAARTYINLAEERQLLNAAL